ncbi:MAG: ABC transporter ATP-binding protein [Mycoplasma sp.]|nr:ABC transporter ATP-binding protein [Mycoplasma sp.]
MLIPFKKNKNNIAIVKKAKPSKTTPIVELKNVSKNFGDFLALKNINLKIMPGEKVGIIGGNGAGKTTLSEIIVGLNKASKGVITYGFEFEKQPQEGIGMQFQDSTYPSGLTVKNIIEFARDIHKLKITNKQLYNLLETFQMEEFYNRKSRSLSGGQRQKLNILLSVLHQPNLIIFDELSTGLDISAREDIIFFAKKLLSDNKMSALLVSHHEAELVALCNRIVIIDRGKIVADETLANILKEHKNLSNYMLKYIKMGNTNAKKQKTSLKLESNLKEKKVNKVKSILKKFKEKGQK